MQISDFLEALLLLAQYKEEPIKSKYPHLLREPGELCPVLPHPPGEVLGDEDVGAAQQLRLPQHSLLVLEIVTIICTYDVLKRKSGWFAIICTKFKLGHCISASPCSPASWLSYQLHCFYKVIFTQNSVSGRCCCCHRQATSSQSLP